MAGSLDNLHIRHEQSTRECEDYQGCLPLACTSSIESASLNGTRHVLSQHGRPGIPFIAPETGEHASLGHGRAVLSSRSEQQCTSITKTPWLHMARVHALASVSGRPIEEDMNELSSDNE